MTDDFVDLETLFGGAPRVHHTSLEFSCQDGLPPLVVSTTSKSDTGLMAHYIWQSAITLSKLIVNAGDGSEYNVKGKTVIELGAGAALPSLVAKRCGAKKVLATDFPSPEIIRAMEENVNANHLKESVIVCGLKWGGDNIDEVMRVMGSKERIDMVLMADTLWMEKAHVDLVRTLRDLCGTSTLVVAAFMHHDFDSTYGSGKVAGNFFTLAKEAGFRIECEEEVKWFDGGASAAAVGEYGNVHVVRMRCLRGDDD